MFRYALVTILCSDTSRRPGGRRGRFAQTAAARGHRAATFSGHLFLSAARAAHRSEGHADFARRDEPHWRAGVLFAGAASGGTLAGVRTLERDWRRHVSTERSQ